MMEKYMTEGTKTGIAERERRPETTTDSLRVDHLLESRHKFVSATPHVITVEHHGQQLRLALPSHSPACEFIVTSATDDLLFLIGSQRAGRDGDKHRGAVVVARRAKNGVYLTELWHETHLSFVTRIHRGKAREAR
jgi:hypothetical protein